MLAFLVGRVVDRKVMSVAELLGQTALACFLGVLCGFFALEAGRFYKVEVSKMSQADVDSLAIKMAIVGVGVGACASSSSVQAGSRGFAPSFQVGT